MTIHVTQLDIDVHNACVKEKGYCKSSPVGLAYNRTMGFNVTYTQFSFTARDEIWLHQNWSIATPFSFELSDSEVPCKY